MPIQGKERQQQKDKSNKLQSAAPSKVNGVMGGQAGEMTFMMHYHFHGLFP